MKVPKIGWIAAMMGALMIGAIVWSGALSRSRPTDQVTAAPESRRAELAQAAKAIGTIAAVHADQPGSPETEKDAGTAPEMATGSPPPDVPPPVSHRSKAREATWSVKQPAKSDGAPEDNSLCGGKVCRADQFCCGPPECGHCTSRLSGPRCPTSCP